MATRQLSLGRVIEWANSCDIEELHYVIHRVANIAQVRAAKVELADRHNQGKTAKRATRKGRDRKDEVQPPATAYEVSGQEVLGRLGRPEVSAAPGTFVEYNSKDIKGSHPTPEEMNKLAAGKAHSA
jgi:hypothetical protein